MSGGHNVMMLGVIASETVSQSGGTSADFKNGIYEIGGNPATFDDLFMPSADWGTVTEGDITEGVGLVGTKFPTIRTSIANSFISSGVTPIFEFDTDATLSTFLRLEFFDAPDYNTEFYVLVKKSTSQSVLAQPGETDNLSGNTVSSAGSHKAAMTLLVDGRLSLSVDGEDAETLAWTADGSAINTVGIEVHANTTLTKVTFMPVQADVDLPTLST